MITNAENSVENQKIKIRTYMNAYKYLTDYFDYRKKQDTQFSYEAWAGELQLKSRSSLRMVCRGQKPITILFIDVFSKQNNLSEEDKNYFYLLAHYQNAKNPTLKRAYLDKILENIDTTESYTEIKSYFRFLSSSALPILQLIISFSDFKATEEKIRKLTGLDAKKTKEGLETLKDLGLAQPKVLETEKEPVWTATIKYFKISDRLHDEALKMYHQETTREAYDILNMQIQLKKFKSIFFSLTESNYADLSKDMEDFIARMKNKYGNENLMDKQLYKINIQAYPVTKKLDFKE
jgi:uncharacterized protein (TIGR02147 family)